MEPIYKNFQALVGHPKFRDGPWAFQADDSTAAGATLQVGATPACTDGHVFAALGLAVLWSASAAPGFRRPRCCRETRCGSVLCDACALCGFRLNPKP